MVVLTQGFEQIKEQAVWVMHGAQIRQAAPAVRKIRLYRRRRPAHKIGFTDIAATRVGTE